MIGVGDVDFFSIESRDITSEGFVDSMFDGVQIIQSFFNLRTAGKLVNKEIVQFSEGGYQSVRYIYEPLKCLACKARSKPFTHTSLSLKLMYNGYMHPLFVLGNVIFGVSIVVVYLHGWVHEMRRHIDHGDLLRVRESAKLCSWCFFIGAGTPGT